MSKKEEEFREANRKAAERAAELQQQKITEDRKRENERILNEYIRNIYRTLVIFPFKIYLEVNLFDTDTIILKFWYLFFIFLYYYITYTRKIFDS